MMRHVSITAAIAAVMLFAGPRRPPAAVITLDRIASTGQPVPGGTDAFTSFYNPATDGTSVVFWGKGVPSEGIYRGAPGGALSAVARSGMPVPETPGNTFDQVQQETSIDEAGMVGFAATSTGQTGIRNGVYTATAGGLQRVVDTSFARPEGGTFNTYTFNNAFSRPAVGAGRTTFMATAPSDPFPGSAYHGIYTNAPGPLTLVTAGTVGELGRPSMSGQRILYRNGNSFRLWDNGSTTTVFSSGDNVPGLGTVFANSDPPLDGTDFAFNGSAGGRDAVVARINGSYVKVVDTATPLPEGGGTFGGFLYDPSIDNGNVAFVAIGLPFPPLKHGVYLYDDGTISKVVNVNDLLDGKTPQDFVIGPEALAGNLLTFRVVFTDQSQGIYVATVPEPAALPVVLGAAASVLGLRRPVRRGARAR